MGKIEHRLRELLCDEFDQDRAEVAALTLDTVLSVALPIDSLDSVEMVMAIEDEYGIFIEDHEAERMTTLRTTIDILVAEHGVHDCELEAYPEINPVIHIPKSTMCFELAPDPFAVVFENSLTVYGKDANLYKDQTKAEEFATILRDRGIEASVYKLVKV